MLHLQYVYWFLNVCMGCVCVCVKYIFKSINKSSKLNLIKYPESTFSLCVNSSLFAPLNLPVLQSTSGADENKTKLDRSDPKMVIHVCSCT